MRIPLLAVHMLQSGCTIAETARAVHLSNKTIADARRALGLPDQRRLARTVDVEEAFYARTQPAGDGHRRWIGQRISGRPTLNLNGRTCLSAHNVAFRLANGRDPEGLVRPGCEWPGCIHPDHQEDRRMRHQYQAIFGEAA